MILLKSCGFVNRSPVDKYPHRVYKELDTREGYLENEKTDRGKERDMDQKECGCGRRHKERSEEERKCLVNRLKRIEGQVRGICRMVEDGAYCPDILVQSAAVSAAMNAFNRELLTAHIRTCVAEDLRAGNEETVGELTALLQKLMK